MKFRKITRIFAVIAFATLMQATQAYADIIKIDAISLGSNPDVFMKFDDKLGSLIDVTYFYSGSTYAEILNDESYIDANDWDEGLTGNVITYVTDDVACGIFCEHIIGDTILSIPSFDIFEGLNIYNIYFDFELSVPTFFAVDNFSIRNNTPRLYTTNNVWNGYFTMLSRRDGVPAGYIEDDV
jgi:hypothetical protein